MRSARCFGRYLFTSYVSGPIKRIAIAVVVLDQATISVTDPLHDACGGLEVEIACFTHRDSGMRAACLAAFQPDIATRRADTFFVRIAKERTITEKRQIIAASRAEFEIARQSNPGLTDTEIENLLIKGRIASMASIGKWQDKWLTHPFPNMSEPERAACYLTDYGDYDTDHLARLRRASR